MVEGVEVTDTFKKALSFVLRWEGGYSDDPNDPGGRTIFGITERDYPSLWEDGGEPTMEDAKRIYRRDYWEACDCGAMPSPIALMVFDSAVNQGCYRSVQFLQKAVGTRPDGVFGPNTRRFMLKEWDRDPHGVLRDLAAYRLQHYALLDDLDDYYALGWARRAVDCLMAAYDMPLIENTP